MTATQPISVRLTADQRAALATAAKQRHIAAGTLAAQVIGEWLEAQAVPVEQQAWYRAGALAAKARDAADRADNLWYRANVPDALQDITNAIHALADAIDVLAGTAPE